MFVTSSFLIRNRRSYLIDRPPGFPRQNCNQIESPCRSEHVCRRESCVPTVTDRRVPYPCPYNNYIATRTFTIRHAFSNGWSSSPLRPSDRSGRPDTIRPRYAISFSEDFFFFSNPPDTTNDEDGEIKKPTGRPPLHVLYAFRSSPSRGFAERFYFTYLLWL